MLICERSVESVRKYGGSIVKEPPHVDKLHQDPARNHKFFFTCLMYPFLSLKKSPRKYIQFRRKRPLKTTNAQEVPISWVRRYDIDFAAVLPQGLSFFWDSRVYHLIQQLEPILAGVLSRKKTLKLVEKNPLQPKFSWRE